MAGKREITNETSEEIMKIKGRKRAYFFKFCIVTVMLIAAFCIFKLAPNYKRNYVIDKTNLVINNNNVTAKMKKDLYIDKNKIVYMSKQDIDNYFDGNIYYDEKYNQIITTHETKIATMVVGENKITVNGVEANTAATILKIDDTYYLPFSELASVYDAEYKYSEDTNTYTIVTLDRKLVKAEATKKLSVKYLPNTFSSTMDKVGKLEELTYISDEGDWAKVRTERGRMGYVKKDKLTNIVTEREQKESIKTGLNEKVNLVWEYYYSQAPDRTGTKINGLNVVSPSFFDLERLGKGKIIDKADKNYINWAKANGYKVWPMVSNNGMIETVSEILNDYKLRQETIDRIIELAVKYDLDGINLDFENMYKKDKDLYSRFVIELEPRLREHGMVLSVDVTAPDGSETWSECFDRNLIGEVADYIVFMAYDQNGTSSPKAGTVSGYDWIERSVDKFLNREEVKPEKLILALPFYTRLWKEQDGALIGSSTVDMNNINSVIPSSVERKWDETTKQYYVEYTQGNITYKMWIEDERSIKEKMSLISKNNLAGVAFWEIDREPESIWNMIKEELKK